MIARHPTYARRLWIVPSFTSMMSTENFSASEDALVYSTATVLPRMIGGSRPPGHAAPHERSLLGVAYRMLGSLSEAEAKLSM
jgi:hypothetical protein